MLFFILIQSSLAYRLSIIVVDWSFFTISVFLQKSGSAERTAEESSIEQISRAMKGLQGLPPNSELYEMQLRHITLISKLRFEREFNKEQLELEKIRQENERVADQNRARLAHEEWMAEQQRILEKQRLNQEVSSNQNCFSALYSPKHCVADQ